jgi:hypothetical protein
MEQLALDHLGGPHSTLYMIHKMNWSGVISDQQRWLQDNGCMLRHRICLIESRLGCMANSLWNMKMPSLSSTFILTIIVSIAFQFTCDAM